MINGDNEGLMVQENVRIPELSIFLTKLQICKYRFQKLRVAFNLRICYIKDMAAV